ncbi:hypothetical protein COCOBI_16-3430 [Coccomyxa sp. Obi]|nr:hypothetical protein COCOBI_16-3430 [Coccomyxa sp. Obi]
MVDQQRLPRASVHQSKYDTYAKPVLLSQPETQERTRLLFSHNDPEVGVVPEQSARKPTPGKLNLDKIRSFSQEEWTATPGQDPVTGSRAAGKAPENFGSGLLLDNTGKENLLSPGRLDLPNGTPLTRHPSDALSRRISPKALPDVAMAQGQITIVAEAVAQYEQKILQGQRQRRGRFSNTSTPDVSRHASVCSSEHPTPREHHPLARGTAETGSGSSGQELGSHTAENGSAIHKSGADEAKAAEDYLAEGGPRQAKSTAAEQPDATDDDAAAAAATCNASGRHDSTDLECGGKRDEARSAAAMPQNPQLDSCGGAASGSGPTVCPASVSVKHPWAASADRLQQPAGSSAHSDAEPLPVSTRASALPGAEPEQRFRPFRGGSSSAAAESACSAITSSRSSPQPEQALPESASHDGRVEPSGDASAAPLMMQSAGDSPGSRGTDESSAAWRPSTAGHGDRTTAAAPSSSGEARPGSRGAAEAGPAAPGTGPGPVAERAGARQQEGRGLQLSAESAREPEWVAAFRRVVSLAVNTPLSQSPAARRISIADGRQSENAATLSPSGRDPPSLGQAPSPSSEGPADEGVAAGWRTGTSGGRNLDTAFESALTDCRRKRLRAEESSHSSGSVVRAAAAVQRAAERATLDRNNYSGACISVEAASALSPGAIALVNGRTGHSRVELQAQLNDVVHQLRFCLASMTEQQRPLLHAIDTLQQGTKVPRRDLAEAAEKLQEAERLRRWSEIAQSENIARLLGIVAELQAVAQARAEEVHLSAPAWLNLLLGNGRSANAAGRLGHC